MKTRGDVIGTMKSTTYGYKIQVRVKCGYDVLHFNKPPFSSITHDWSELPLSRTEPGQRGVPINMGPLPLVEELASERMVMSYASAVALMGVAFSTAPEKIQESLEFRIVKVILTLEWAELVEGFSESIDFNEEEEEVRWKNE